jgi:hypothetical protein
MNGAPDIVFGQDANQASHTFRHTDGPGLHREEVIDAISADIRPYLPLAMRPPGVALFVRRVTVRGVELTYHAYPLNEGLVNEGLVNVGRITGP